MRELTKYHFQCDSEKLVEELVENALQYKDYLENPSNDSEECRYLEVCLEGSTKEEDIMTILVVGHIWLQFNKILIFQNGYKHIQEMLKNNDPVLNMFNIRPECYSMSMQESFTRYNVSYVHMLKDNEEKIKKEFNTFLRTATLNMGGSLCRLKEGIYHIDIIAPRNYIIQCSLGVFHGLYTAVVKQRSIQIEALVPAEMIIFGNFFEFIGGSSNKIKFDRIEHLIEDSIKEIMIWSAKDEKRSDFVASYKPILLWMHMFKFKNPKMVRQFVRENAEYGGELLQSFSTKFILGTLVEETEEMSGMVHRFVDAHFIQKEAINEIKKS